MWQEALNKIKLAWEAMPQDDPLLPAGVRSEWHAWKQRMAQAIQDAEKKMQRETEVEKAVADTAARELGG